MPGFVDGRFSSDPSASPGVISICALSVVKPTSRHIRHSVTLAGTRAIILSESPGLYRRRQRTHLTRTHTRAGPPRPGRERWTVRGFYRFLYFAARRGGGRGAISWLPGLSVPGPQSSQSGVFNPWAGSSKQLKTHFSSMFQASKGSLLTLRAGRVRAGGELSAEHQRGSVRGSAAIRILVRDGDLRTSMWCRTHGLRVNTRGHLLTCTGSIQAYREQASFIVVSRNTQGPKQAHPSTPVTSRLLAWEQICEQEPDCEPVEG